jgi:hypothetical protein
VLKKKIWANFQRIIELFNKKIVKKLLKIWSWDPGSEIRDPGSGKNLFRIPDPGVKKHPIPDPGSGSATLCPSLFKGSDQRENRGVWSNINTRYLVWRYGDGRSFVL